MKEMINEIRKRNQLDLLDNYKTKIGTVNKESKVYTSVYVGTIR